MAFSAIIKYNNAEIATATENDSKILDCNGKYTENNLVVSLEKVFDPVFNNNSWDDIKLAVNTGKAASYWKVGDRKAVTLNGTVGTKSFSNTTTYCYILGFDHNKSRESNNNHALHIGFGATALSGGAYIAYVDSSYGSQASSSCFNMNTSNTNSGGWNSCQMKSTICPAFKNVLPAELQSNIRMVTKYQNNGNSTNVRASFDTIWLLSEMEIFGSAKYSNCTANQLQYDFYKGVADWSAAPKIKYKDTSTSQAALWWERSACSSNDIYFCCVFSDGRAYSDYAYSSWGFAPCLCL